MDKHHVLVKVTGGLVPAKAGHFEAHACTCYGLGYLVATGALFSPKIGIVPSILQSYLELLSHHYVALCRQCQQRKQCVYRRHSQRRDCLLNLG